MEQPDWPAGITVTGSGSITLEPEVATLDAGVSLTGVDLSAARSATAAKATAARDHLLAAGVAPADLQTSRLHVHSSFDRATRTTTYHLSTGLRAVIRDLDTASSVVDGLFDAIGDGLELRGLELGLEDPATGRDAARQAAFEDARRAAEHLASLAGVSLGPVQSIVEGNELHGGPGPMRLAARAGGAEMPVEAGTVERHASVTVRWAIAG